MAGRMERKRNSDSSLLEKRGKRPPKENRDQEARHTTYPRRRRSDLRLRIQVPPGCPAFVADPAFREIVSVRIYGRNATIVTQGDPARFAYILRRGLVQVTSMMPNGKSFMDLMGPGSVFGVPWMLTGQPHGFGFSALDECEFDQVDALLFRTYLEQNPAAALEILRQLSRQEIQLIRHMLLLTVRVPSSERLLTALLEVSRMCGESGESGVRITVPLTIQMLADKIGCSRQWVSKLMGELEAQGKLRRKGTWITLTSSDSRSPDS